MDDLVSWLATSLARFELPSPTDAPPDLQLLLAQAFADFTGRNLTSQLAARIQQESQGQVSLFRARLPSELQPRGPSAFLAVTGQRRVLLTPSDPALEWVD